MLSLTCSLQWLLKSSIHGLAMLKARDVVGELQGRNIYNVTDQIIFYLDWDSMKNASLVSKGWREAVLIALHRISKNGNPYWSAEQLSSWQRIESHLKSNFKVSVQDPCYPQCLLNSIDLIIGHLQVDDFWPKPEMTLDYLPFRKSFDQSEHPLLSHLCRMEMSNNFIITWESSTRLFKCWSRRTLSPINMDKVRNLPSISMDDGHFYKHFHLTGNYLIYAEHSASNRRDYFAQVELSRIDLDATNREINQDEEFKATLYVEPPSDEATLFLVYLNAVDNMVLLMFSVYIDERWVGDLVTVQRNLQRQEARDIHKKDLLQVPPLEESHGRNILFDKDYFVVQLDENPDEEVAGFRIYSLDPPRDGGGMVELRLMASFQLVTPWCINFRDGLLSYITHTGVITLVDVTNGFSLKYFQSQINFDSDGSMMSLGKGVLICSEEIVPEESASSPENDVPGLSVDAKGTKFHVWDLRSILNQPNEEVEATPICTFRTLTSSLSIFEVDEFGIAAVVEDDPAMGIQVLSFLPACSHCKRLTKLASLKKCSRCQSAAYCSKDCQKADWNPHHKAICVKVAKWIL